MKKISLISILIATILYAPLCFAQSLYGGVIAQQLFNSNMNTQLQQDEAQQQGWLNQANQYYQNQSQQIQNFYQGIKQWEYDTDQIISSIDQISQQISAGNVPSCSASYLNQANIIYGIDRARYETDRSNENNISLTTNNTTYMNQINQYNTQLISDISGLGQEMKQYMAMTCSQAPSTTKQGTVISTNSNQSTSFPTLQIGSSGTWVKYLQSLLIKANDLPSDDATAYFGKATRQAVTLWQGQNNLSATGIADAQTWSSLYSKYSGN